MSDSPLIIGHRGASAHAPENTLGAFQMAIDAGADGVEFDVQLSKDGVPVVIHDESLRRTGLRNEMVADLTAKELSEIDIGSWFNHKYPQRSRPDFARETVPTLVRVLKLLEQTKGVIYIELKCGAPNYAALAEAVCDVIRYSPQLGQMIVKSFKLAAIPVVRHHLPQVQTAALFEPNILNILRRRRHIIAIAHDFGAQQISIHTSLATKRLTALAAKAQMPVTIWTTDKTQWITRAHERKIRAVITNNPQKLLKTRHATSGQNREQ